MAAPKGATAADDTDRPGESTAGPADEARSPPKPESTAVAEAGPAPAPAVAVETPAPDELQAALGGDDDETRDSALRVLGVALLGIVSGTSLDDEYLADESGNRTFQKDHNLRLAVVVDAAFTEEKLVAYFACVSARLCAAATAARDALRTLAAAVPADKGGSTGTAAAAAAASAVTQRSEARASLLASGPQLGRLAAAAAALLSIRIEVLRQKQEAAVQACLAAVGELLHELGRAEAARVVVDAASPLPAVRDSSSSSSAPGSGTSSSGDDGGGGGGAAPLLLVGVKTACVALLYCCASPAQLAAAARPVRPAAVAAPPPAVASAAVTAQEKEASGGGGKENGAKHSDRPLKKKGKKDSGGAPDSQQNGSSSSQNGGETPAPTVAATPPPIDLITAALATSAARAICRAIAALAGKSYAVESQRYTAMYGAPLLVGCAAALLGVWFPAWDYGSGGAAGGEGSGAWMGEGTLMMLRSLVTSSVVVGAAAGLVYYSVLLAPSAPVLRAASVHMFLCTDAAIAALFTALDAARVAAAAAAAAALESDRLAGSDALSELCGFDDVVSGAGTGLTSGGRGGGGAPIGDDGAAEVDLSDSSGGREGAGYGGATTPGTTGLSQLGDIDDLGLLSELLFEEGQVLGETEDGQLVVLSKEEAIAALGPEQAALLARQTAEALSEAVLMDEKNYVTEAEAGVNSELLLQPRVDLSAGSSGVSPPSSPARQRLATKGAAALMEDDPVAPGESGSGEEAADARSPGAAGKMRAQPAAAPRDYDAASDTRAALVAGSSSELAAEQQLLHEEGGFGGDREEKEDGDFARGAEDDGGMIQYDGEGGDYDEDVLQGDGGGGDAAAEGEGGGDHVISSPRPRLIIGDNAAEEDGQQQQHEQERQGGDEHQQGEYEHDQEQLEYEQGENDAPLEEGGEEDAAALDPALNPPEEEQIDLAQAIGVSQERAKDMLVSLAVATELFVASQQAGAAAALAAAGQQYDSLEEAALAAVHDTGAPDAPALLPPPLVSPFIPSLIPPEVLTTLFDLYQHLMAAEQPEMAQVVADRIVFMGEVIASSQGDATDALPPLTPGGRRASKEAVAYARSQEQPATPPEEAAEVSDEQLLAPVALGESAMMSTAEMVGEEELHRQAYADARDVTVAPGSQGSAVSGLIEMMVHGDAGALAGESKERLGGGRDASDPPQVTGGRAPLSANSAP